MQTILDSADQPAHDAFVEKKSEFIGDACHIDSLDEALAFVQTIRDQHPKARHVAYAAVCGGSDGRLAERMSDDGEPSGTAGKPILDVLRANRDDGLRGCRHPIFRRYSAGFRRPDPRIFHGCVHCGQSGEQSEDRAMLRISGDA